MESKVAPELEQPVRELDPEVQRDVDRAKRDVKLIGFFSIGMIVLMIVVVIVAVLLAYES